MPETTFQTWLGTRLVFSQADSSRIADAVLDRIIKGKCTISDFQELYKDLGFRGLSKNVDAEKFLETLGFALVRIYTKGTSCIRSTEVTL